MADNKKKPQTLQQKLDAASARNVQGLGWNASDFGIRDVGGLNNPTLAPIADGVQEGQNVQPSNVVNSNTPATSYTTPQERQKFKASYNMTQEEVNAASGPFHAGASFLGRLFDTTDPVKENIAESVWDGAWGFVNGVYNTINATTVAGISALPGGTRTLTYKEAGDVSVFQELAASATKSATKIKTGEGNLWDILSLTPLSALALDENNPLSNPNFDVTDPAQKKAAFQDNAVNKWTTGLGDAAFTIFADPFIAAGKFAKMGRLRYLDRTFQGEAGRALLKQELEYGAGKITEATATGIAPKISPAAQFVHWATEKAPDSSAKMRTASEIFNHPFIQRASNRELISSALYHADDYDTASLIMRYAYNDLDAGKELFNKQAAIVDGMGKAQRDRVMTMMALDPGNLKQAQKIARTAASKAQTRLDELETANMQGTNEWQMLTKARDNAQQTLGDLTDLKPSMLDPFHSQLISFVS